MRRSCEVLAAATLVLGGCARPQLAFDGRPFPVDGARAVAIAESLHGTAPFDVDPTGEYRLVARTADSTGFTLIYVVADTAAVFGNDMGDTVYVYVPRWEPELRAWDPGGLGFFTINRR